MPTCSWWATGPTAYSTGRGQRVVQVLRVNGPSKAVLRDFSTSGAGNAEGISIEGADQVGARVFLDDFWSEPPLGTSVVADGLVNTFVELHGPSPTNGLNGTQPLYSVRGVGGAGASVTAIFGGMNYSGSSTAPLWDVQNGGRLMVLDAWYKGGWPVRRG